MKRSKAPSEMSFEDMVSQQITQKGHENLAKAHKNQDLNYKLDQSFPDTPLSSEEHGHPHWTGYNDILFHDAVAHKNLVPSVRSAGGTSKFIQVVGFPGREDKSVLKAPLDWKDLRLSHNQEDPNGYSHLLHRQFNTAHRDAAFHSLAKHIFGLDHFVPPTTVFRHPRTNEDWSAQKFVDGATPFIHNEQLSRHKDEDLHKLALMEAILGHNDRNKSNVLFDRNGDMKLIDNALAFDYSHRYGTPTPSYAHKVLGQDVPPSVHNWIDSLSGSELSQRLSDMGAPANITNSAAARLAHIKDWSSAIRQNRHFSQDLAGGLDIAQSHRMSAGMQRDPIFEQAAWNRVQQGVPHHSKVGSEDKTAPMNSTKRSDR